MGKNGKRIDSPNVNSYVVGVGRSKPKAHAAPEPVVDEPKASPAKSTAKASAKA